MISLVKLINEWKLSAPLASLDVKKVKIFNAPLLNLKIGKWDVDKGQKGYEYSWEEAIKNKFISTPTANRVMRICNKLGITPERVYIGWYANKHEYINLQGNKKVAIKINLKSTYVLAYYKNEPIIFAQRQTYNDMSGQFYVYSKYKKSGKVARIGNSSYYTPRMEDPAVTKEQILNFLQIKDNNTSLAENQPDKFIIKNFDYYRQLVSNTKFSPVVKRKHFKKIKDAEKYQSMHGELTFDLYDDLQQIKKGLG